MRWVVLLRAVNLGARNKVPMAELRALLEEAGHGDVRTYIASGNVLLDGPRDRAAVADELERLVADSFGVTTTAVVRKPAELAALVAGHPFGPDTSRSHVVFLATRPAKAAVDGLAAADHAPDRAVVAGANVYVQYGGGVQNARLSAARLERLLGVPATHRKLAYRRRAGPARRGGVGSRRHRAKEGSMALARVVSFDGVDSDRIAALASEIQDGDPPEGLDATEMMLLHDPEANRALAVLFFDDEDAYRRGDEILDAMPAGDTPGARTGVTKYDVTARVTS